jgi:O-acetyl-ADP-ribose deacetylase (regulator of RNase III)
LLINRGILTRDCLTTNFDKLIERAFHDVGVMECQPIRSSDELQFHQQLDDKAFCIKVHGDYDTHNVLNTEEETVVIDPSVNIFLEELLRNRGLIVIGSAGFEKSIHTLFDRLTSKDAASRRVLRYGLLWGVYTGEGAAEPMKEVERLVEGGQVSPEIVKIMDRNYRADTPFAFFPVVGAGEFLRRLMIYSGDAELVRLAEPYFDHEMRIRHLFRQQGLSEKAFREHVGRLRQAQKRAESGGSPSNPIVAFRDQEVPRSSTMVSLLYGSLADARLLQLGRKDTGRAAIVSPDDTFISIGGGTALALARGAGERGVLHDVSKLAPLRLGQVAVTSAGKLPVEYLFHGASVEIREDGVNWSEESIYGVMKNALRCAISLGVTALFAPLLAAGTGRAPAARSAHQILRAVFELDRDLDPAVVGASSIRVNIVVFSETELPRQEYAQEYQSLCQARNAFQRT